MHGDLCEAREDSVVCRKLARAPTWVALLYHPAFAESRVGRLVGALRRPANTPTPEGAKRLVHIANKVRPFHTPQAADRVGGPRREQSENRTVDVCRPCGWLAPGVLCDTGVMCVDLPSVGRHVCLPSDCQLRRRGIRAWQSPAGLNHTRTEGRMWTAGFAAP